jgi:hypothetical protein
MRIPAISSSCPTLALLALGLSLSTSCRADTKAEVDAEGAGDTMSHTLRLDIDAPKPTRWDVYVTGYSYHDRDTYTKAQLNKMNEMTWGGGLGRTLRNERGNDESLYVIGMRDSNERAQWMAGYAYQWVFPVKSSFSNLELGAGLTGVIIRRQDWYDGRPFPAILPVFSVGTRAAQLLATYVPHLSARKKKGNIVSVMLKFSL